MEKRSDAPRNLEEMRRMNTAKALELPDYLLEQIDRRWRNLGRLAKDPTALMGADKY